MQLTFFLSRVPENKMGKGLELRLIEKGFDPSKRDYLELKQAAQVIKDKYLNSPRRAGVIFFNGGTLAKVEVDGVVTKLDGTLLIDDSEDGQKLTLYSAEDLLNGRNTSIWIPKNNYQTIAEVANDADKKIIVVSLYGGPSMGGLSKHRIAISITPEPDTSAGYFPALPDGVPRDRVLWRAIGNCLGLNLKEVTRGVYKAVAYPDSPALRVEFTFKAESDSYIVQAEFADPQYDDLLRSHVDGLDIKSLVVDGKPSKYVKGDKATGEKIKRLETHFNIGKAHQVFDYLQRVLGKQVSQVQPAYRKI